MSHRTRNALVLAAAALACPAAPPALAQTAQVTGWAAIPSTFRVPGPTSGQFTGGGNGVTTPFVNQQVIPGFSGFIPSGTPGHFLGLPDNGFGAQNNSADYVLGFYDVVPNFKTTGDGTTTPGGVAVGAFTAFNDANGILTANGANFVSGGPVYARTNYYPGSSVPVDPSIATDRRLTGADFDVESIARMNDGTFWVGEEFGPYLLHFNASGTLVDAPVPHPVLRAPQNPTVNAGNPSNLGSSRGFESMTRNADGSRLYLTTEAAIASEPDRRLLTMYEFDPAAKAYTGATFTYRKETLPGGTGDEIFTGDMTNVGGSKYVVIERDNGENSGAVIKKLFLIDLAQTGPDGVLLKRELVNLLDVADPADIGGPQAYAAAADRFTLPIQSVEAVTLVDPSTLAVAVDTNYPFGNGRLAGRPDDTEVMLIHFGQPLESIAVPEPASLGLLAAAGALAVTYRRCLDARRA